MFSRAEIRDIIGRASTIDERRAGICVVEEPEDETTREQVRDRLMAQRANKNVPFSDEEARAIFDALIDGVPRET